MDAYKEIQMYLPFLEYLIENSLGNQEELNRIGKIVQFLRNKDPNVKEANISLKIDSIAEYIKRLYKECKDDNTVFKFKKIFQPAVFQPIEISDSSDEEITFLPCKDDKIITPSNNSLPNIKLKLDLQKEINSVELSSTDDEDNHENCKSKIIDNDSEKLNNENSAKLTINKSENNFAKKSTSGPPKLFTRRKEEADHAEESDTGSVSPEYNDLSSDDECERLKIFERRDNNKVKDEGKHELYNIKPITVDSNLIIIDSDSDHDVHEKNISNEKLNCDLQEKNLDELEKLRNDIENQLIPVSSFSEKHDTGTLDLNSVTLIPKHSNPTNLIQPILNIPIPNPNDPRCKNRIQLLYNTNPIVQVAENQNTQFSNIKNIPIPHISKEEILKGLDYEYPVIPPQQHKKQAPTTYGEYRKKKEQEKAKRRAEFEAKRKREEELEIAKTQVPIDKVKKIPASESVIDKMYRNENWDTNTNLPTSTTTYRIPKKSSTSTPTTLSKDVIKTKSSLPTNCSNNGDITPGAVKRRRKSMVIDRNLTTTKSPKKSDTISENQNSKFVAKRRRKSMITDNNFRTTETPNQSDTISENQNSNFVTSTTIVNSGKAVTPKNSTKKSSVGKNKTPIKTLQKRKDILEKNNGNLVTTTIKINSETAVTSKSCTQKNSSRKTEMLQKTSISEKYNSSLVTTTTNFEKSIKKQSSNKDTNQIYSSDSESSDTTIKIRKRRRVVRRIDSTDNDTNNNKSSISSTTKSPSEQNESVNKNYLLFEEICKLSDDQSAKMWKTLELLKKSKDLSNTNDVSHPQKMVNSNSVIEQEQLLNINTKITRKRKKNEGEKLIDDIEKSYIGKECLSVYGRRSCQINQYNKKLQHTHSDDENPSIHQKKFDRSKLMQRRKSCFASYAEPSDIFAANENFCKSYPDKKQELESIPNDEDYDTDDFSAHLEEKKINKEHSLYNVPKLPIKEVVIRLERLTNEEILRFTKKSFNVANVLQPLKVKPINAVRHRRPSQWVSNYLNNNSSHHFENQEIINSCLLCGKTSKNLVSHYVNLHDEVFISRLCKSTIDLYQKTKNYGYLIPNSSTKYKVYCIFCKNNCIDTQLRFYEHYASHTGEFAYQCEVEKCEVKYPYEKQIKQHCKTLHKNVRCYKQMYSYNKDLKIKISICNICNFVQLNEANIIKHLKTQHSININCQDYLNELILVEFKMFDSNELVQIENENIVDRTQSDISKTDISGSKEPVFEMENSSDIDIGSEDEVLIETFVKEENVNFDIILSDFIDTKKKNIMTTINYSKALNIDNQISEIYDKIDEKPVLSELDKIFSLKDQNTSNNGNIDNDVQTLHKQTVTSESMMTAIEENNNPNIIPEGESLLQNTANDSNYLDLVEHPDDLHEKNTQTKISNESKAVGDFEISKITSTVNNMFDLRIDQKNSSEKFEINKIISKQHLLKPWLKVRQHSSTDGANILNNINYFNLYKCTCCCYSTNIYLEAVIHYNSHKSNLNIADSTLSYSWLECPYCENKLSSSEDLVKHITFEHGYCNYQCPKCYYRSYSAFSVSVHQNQLHKDVNQILLCKNYSERNITEEYKEIIESRKKFVKPYSCHLCHKGNHFYISNCLKEHIKTNHKNALHCGCENESTFSCIFCHFDNNDTQEMINHIVNHHPNKNVIACARIWNSKYKDKVSDKVESTILVTLSTSSMLKSKELIVDVNSSKKKLDEIGDILYKHKKHLRILASNANDSILEIQKFQILFPNILKNIEIKSAEELQIEFIKLTQLRIDKLKSSSEKNSIYICYLCGKITITQNVMDRHLSLHHNIECSHMKQILKNNNTKVCYNAVIPSGIFCKSDDELIKHMVNILKINENNIKNILKINENNTNIIEPIKNICHNIPKYILVQKRYQCPEKNCKFLGRNENTIERHFQQIHRRYATYKCLFCPFNINNEIKDFKVIKDHLRMHSEIIFSCCKCNFVNHLRQTVSEHVRKEHKCEMNITKLTRKLTSENILNINYDTCLENGFTTLNMSYCVICCEKMIKNDNIAQHLYAEHQCNVLYQCRYCKTIFITQDEIANHISGDHKKIIRIRCIFDININEKNNDKEIDNNKNINEIVQNSTLPIISNVILIPSLNELDNTPNNMLDGEDHSKRNSPEMNSSINLNENNDKKLNLNKNILPLNNISTTINNEPKSSQEIIGKKLLIERYECKECGFQSNCNEIINLHKKIDHIKPGILNPGYYCDECEFLCENKNDLIEHKINLHNNNLKPYKCNNCNLQFVNERQHQKHTLATHLQIAGFFCDKCSKYYDSCNHLLQHQISDYGKSYAKKYPMQKICKKCEKVFDNDSQLKEHETSEHFLYYCKECKFTCDSKFYLRIHNNECHEKTNNKLNKGDSAISLKTPQSPKQSTAQLLTEIPVESSEKSPSQLSTSDKSTYQLPVISSGQIALSVKSSEQSALQLSRQASVDSTVQLTDQFPVRSSRQVSPPIEPSLELIDLTIESPPKPSSLLKKLLQKSATLVPAVEYSVTSSVLSATIQSIEPSFVEPIEQNLTTSVNESQSPNQIQPSVKLSAQSSSQELNLSSAEVPVLVQQPVKPPLQSPVPASTQIIGPVLHTTTGTLRLVPIEKLVNPNLLNVNINDSSLVSSLKPVDIIVSQQNHDLSNQMVTQQIPPMNLIQSTPNYIESHTNNINPLDINRIMLPEFNFKYINDIIYICYYCNNEFYDIQSILNHWRTIHTIEKENPFQYSIQEKVRCGYCTWTGTFKSSKQHHLQLHCPNFFNIRKNVSSNIIKCVECSFVTANEISLNEHLIAYHPNLINQNELTTKLITEELLLSILKIGYRAIEYKCNSCAYSFFDKEFCKNHINNIHNITERNYTINEQNRIYYGCKECLVFYDTQKNALTHIREKHTNPYLCVYCNQSINNYKDLIVHYRVTHNKCADSRYKCQQITEDYNNYTKKLHLLFANGLVLSLSDLENTKYGNKANIIKELLEIEATEFNSLTHT